MQKFAEKPKGKELDAMKVDTTVLGMDHSCKSVRLLYVVTSGHNNYILGSESHAPFCQWSLNNMQRASRLETKNAKVQN